jgi:hypothetical protein
MPAWCGRSYWVQLRLPISAGLRWNRAMAILSSGLSIVELTVFLCAIILTLIPLTIRVLCDLESRKRDGWSRPGQKSIRAKIN